jgi:glyoxylase-like metal-dependent hydrolase (beta-lactamase superfamily II)
MAVDADLLPAWVTWQRRPFPDANLLLLPGRQAALVDSGFVGHAQETAEWVRTQTGRRALVVNTHWHSDHVGGARHRRPTLAAPRRRPGRRGLVRRTADPRVRLDDP